MSDSERPSRISGRAKIVLAIIALIVWTGLAGQWADKDCNLIPQSYFITLTHGTPDSGDGCVDGVYSDQYGG